MLMWVKSIKTPVIVDSEPSALYLCYTLIFFALMKIYAATSAIAEEGNGIS
jgi:hypothetical protein